MKGRRGGLALFCSPHRHKIVRPVQGMWDYTNKGSPVSNRYKGDIGNVIIVQKKIPLHEKEKKPHCKVFFDFFRHAQKVPFCLHAVP